MQIAGGPGWDRRQSANRGIIIPKVQKFRKAALAMAVLLLCFGSPLESHSE